MTTLDQVLETALQLTEEQQELLIKVLQNRHHESRRAEIAGDAQQTLADFRAGKFRPQSAEDGIAALRQSLHESDA
jgi:DNA-binding protein H-NS